MPAFMPLGFPNQYTVRPQGTIGECLIDSTTAFVGSS